MFMIELGGDNHYSFFDLSPDASAAEIRDARDKLYNKLETEKGSVKDPAERARIEEKLKDVGKKGDELARPESREKYDRENAHLRFLVVQPAAAPMFRSRVDRAFVLDQRAREFLARKGVEVSPLCDLGRTDFSADFTPIPDFDRLLED
jgi:curved DNA-binding protein CbpA